VDFSDKIVTLTGYIFDGKIFFLKSIYSVAAEIPVAQIDKIEKYPSTIRL